MTQMDKWFTAALVALAVLAIYAVATHAATRDGNWYTFAASDTLFNQYSSTAQVFKIEGCNGFAYHVAGQGADSVTVTVEGSFDGANWFALDTPALQDWSSGYTKLSKSIAIAEAGLNTEPPASPARWARLQVTCAGDSASTTLDPDTLINVTVGVTCGGYW